MSLKAVVLGCGNSSGVPGIGNHWGHCDPKEPKNRRGRSSLAVVSQTTTIVVDTGPDFREQFNRENLSSPDAVFYSHAHGDHCHGIDDLRSFYFRGSQKPLPVYANAQTFEDLQSRFRYLFEGGNNEFFYPPVLEAREFKDSDFGKEHRIGDISFVPFLVDHGSCVCTGYRFGDLAYTVDMKALDDQALDILKGVKTWIADAAAYTMQNNAVHANIEDIIVYHKTIKAEAVYLSSLTSLMDYQSLIRELPEGFAPAYDGLQIEIG